MTGTAVTTRTAITHEDLSTNAKTQQLEEKTVATTTKQIADRQEQKTITQEVKTTVTSGEPQQVSSFNCSHISMMIFPVLLNSMLIYDFHDFVKINQIAVNQFFDFII